MSAVCILRKTPKLLTIDHVLNLAGGKLSDRVGNGDVGTTTGGLLGSSDLKDTIDINLENNLKDGITRELLAIKHSKLIREIYPARMGGIGARVNSPKDVLSSQLTRSPKNLLVLT